METSYAAEVVLQATGERVDFSINVLLWSNWMSMLKKNEMESLPHTMHKTKSIPGGLKKLKCKNFLIGKGFLKTQKVFELKGSNYQEKD